ncbi:uncharacterized protein [Spinacia oleracea]|uniref:DUF4283 domain-containing protein n=1 Tax=Spinacia oleracea TaxID=3562 RepID=A0ABM3RSJ8_SPIOL|nr:uncharacterized protein LOC110779521 [Spinacia oleracea]
MARKSGSKSQSSKHGNEKGKPRGPSSDSQALKTRSIEEVMGVEALDFGLENEIFTPKSGLQHLQTRSEARHSFNEFMEVIHGSANQMNQDTARSNMETVSDNIDVSEIHSDESNPFEIDFDDIQEEIDFWSSDVVCYIVGANPPINVMEGFIRRIWKQLNVDKVVMVRKGVFLVRFLTMDSRDKVLKGHYFFDSKPLILKPWNSDMNMDTPELQSVPIWVQLKLNFKYWGEKALFKIVAQLSKPLRRDHATICRDKLQFARVMVDVPLSQELPDFISFRDENGIMVRVAIFYEWRPTMCTKCKMFGHLQTECRQGQKKIWVRKAPPPVSVPVQPTVQGEHVVSPIVDQEGFQRSLRPIRVRVGIETPVRTSSVFQVLEASLLDNEELVGGQYQGDEQRIKYAVGLVGLLEHKVKIYNLGKLYQKVFVNWCFTSNSSYHSVGRIVVAWKAGCFTVNIVVASSQFVHCHVTPVSGRKPFYCTFVYAYNDAGMRQNLWRDLLLLNTQDPWIVCGDFNCVMALDERIGAPVRHRDIVDVSNCMHACGMEDIKCVGNLFTWYNKQKGNNRVFSKIDRFMANHAWQSCFLVAEVCFMPEGHFDHSPGLLSVYPRDDGGKKPFKYFTMWKPSTVFSDTVQQAWNTRILGTKMFILINKLKRVKLALKELNKVGFTDIHAADLRAYQTMVSA